MQKGRLTDSYFGHHHPVIVIAALLLVAGIIGGMVHYKFKLDVPEGYIGVAISEEGKAKFLPEGSHGFVQWDNPTSYVVKLGGNSTTIDHCEAQSLVGDVVNFVKDNKWIAGLHKYAKVAVNVVDYVEVAQTCTRIRLDYTITQDNLSKLVLASTTTGKYEEDVLIPHITKSFSTAIDEAKEEQEVGVWTSSWNFIARKDSPEVDLDMAAGRADDLMHETVIASLHEEYGLEVEFEVLGVTEDNGTGAAAVALVEPAAIEMDHESTGGVFRIFKWIVGIALLLVFLVMFAPLIFAAIEGALLSTGL